MKLIIAGRGREVRGFAVAGVETVACETARDAHGLLDRLTTDVGLFIVSSWFARSTGDRLARLRDRKGPPVVLVLPADLQDDAPGR